MKYFKYIFLLGLLLVTSNVFAAQDVTVMVDNAIIRKEPKESSEILEYLPVGTEIRTSSNPVAGGWYKVRSRNGEYGWIHEGFLSVSQRYGGVPKKNPGAYAQVKQAAQPLLPRKMVIRPILGLQFGNAADINDIFTFNEFTMFNYFGGEFGYRWNRNFGFLIRADIIIKDLVAKESITQVTYNLGLRSYPLMAGAEYFVIMTPPFQMSLAGYIGFALNTSFNLQAVNLNAPNAVTLSESPLTWMLRLNLTRPLGKTFSVFAEGGYRYIVTSELSTAAASTTNGGQVFVKNGGYMNRIIDLSGFTAGIGVGVHF